jgi:hypothetical protein
MRLTITMYWFTEHHTRSNAADHLYSLQLAAWVSTIGGLTNQHKVADLVAVA